MLEKEWRNDPLNSEKRITFKKSEALKKKHLQKRKNDSWNDFLSNLGSHADSKIMWRLMNKMLGRNRITHYGPAVLDTGKDVIVEEPEIAEKLLKSMLAPSMETTSTTCSIIASVIDREQFSSLNTSIKTSEVL